MQIRLISNLHALERVTGDGVTIDFVRYPRAPIGRLALLRLLWRARRCDYALINCAPRDLFLLCLAKLAWPWARCKIVSLDTVLPVPRVRGLRDRVGLWLKRMLFRRVHLFIEYFKETQGYERHYGIPREKFRYVPFKINRYETVVRTPTCDDGYIFCGGNTRRDFATLIAAARELPYPVKIVTMQNAVISGHGSYLDERELPPHIKVVRHDGSDSFVDYIAAARLVVLPIKKENISASGIGVYLAAMALGKCVVISAGPAVNGIVPEGGAIIVPPEDPAALRAAIERAFTDAAYRNAVATVGQRYALSLGGEERLCVSVREVLVADARGGGDAGSGRRP